MDQRKDVEILDETIATEDTQPDWGGGKKRKTKKRRKPTKKTRKHK